MFSACACVRRGEFRWKAFWNFGKVGAGFVGEIWICFFSLIGLLLLWFTGAGWPFDNWNCCKTLIFEDVLGAACVDLIRAKDPGCTLDDSSSVCCNGRRITKEILFWDSYLESKLPFEFWDFVWKVYFELWLLPLHVQLLLSKFENFPVMVGLSLD